METSSAEQLVEPRLIHVEPQRLPQAWPYIEPILADVCAKSDGEISINRILANLENWPILVIVNGDHLQAVMVTYVSEHEDGARTLHCLAAGGDAAAEWPKVDEQFDAFARSLGCTRVRIDRARKGWLKTLPHWTWVGVVLEREI